MIRDFLNATRNTVEFIEDKNNRFPHYVEAIHGILGDYDIKAIFIRSQECKSQIVDFGQEKTIIIDRQADLYINSLSVPECLFVDSPDKYADSLFSSMMFISCNELFYLNQPSLAKKLLSHYVPSSERFNIPIDFFGEMSRLNFTVFHEWGHAMFNEKSELAKTLTDDVQFVFSGFVDEITHKACQNNEYDKNIYYRTYYTEYFEKNNLEECCVDYLSAMKAFSMMDEEDSCFIAMGGKENYVLNCLITIHQYLVIRAIKEIVVAALDDEPWDSGNVNLFQQRLRVTRQILNRYLASAVGDDNARETHNKFTDYLQRVHVLTKNEMYEQIYRVIQQNRNLVFEKGDAEKDSEFCLKKFAWT